MTRVALIRGDGIGPAVVEAARRCLEALDVGIEFVEVPMGEDAIAAHDTPLPEETVDAVEDCGVALKGPVTTPVGSGFRSVNVALRRALDLYANVRPCRGTPGVPTRLDAEGVDLVVVRENLEDLYMGIEYAPGEDRTAAFEEFLAADGHETPAGAAYSVKPISRRGSERIVRHACEYAEAHGYDSVTAVDKANILKATDGLFMDAAETVAQEYDVAYAHVLVDNMAQQLVRRPEAFDVIVTQNIYGDILSDLAGGLVGGIGLIPSANVGEEAAVFGTVHGSAPDIAGEGVANPTAAIRSAAMLLDRVEEGDAATRLRDAVDHVLQHGPVTPDLGGDASTDAFTEAVVARLG